MNRWLFLSLVFLVCAENRAVRSEEATVPREIISLFNGRDLAGWATWLADTKQDDPRGVFSVREGAIRISGDGRGYLATEKSYRDYRLVAEFRWGEKSFLDRKAAVRDAGLFLHSQGPDGNSFDGNGAYRAAIECQIMQGAVADFLIIKGRDESGRVIEPQLSVRARPERDAENFLSWTKQQPWMVLHELTHGYHHRVLTHEYAPLRDCYRAAMKEKRYDSVLDYAGRRRRAYAANNVEEYFAEATEAFFGTNDFYPFVRPELREHDAELYRVLERIWAN